MMQICFIVLFIYKYPFSMSLASENKGFLNSFVKQETGLKNSCGVQPVKLEGGAAEEDQPGPIKRRFMTSGYAA